MPNETNSRLEQTLIAIVISVSASSQTVPEAIQKWHESSKFLEQNQTALSASIYEIKIRIEKIEKDVSQATKA